MEKRKDPYFDHRLNLYLPEEYCTAIRVQAAIERKTLGQFIVEQLDKAGLKKSLPI